MVGINWESSNKYRYGGKGGGMLCQRVPCLQDYLGGCSWGSTDMQEGANEQCWQVCGSGTQGNDYFGHLPRKMSKVCSLFLRRGGSIRCKVTGSRRYSSDLRTTRRVWDTMLFAININHWELKCFHYIHIHHLIACRIPHQHYLHEPNSWCHQEHLRCHAGHWKPFTINCGLSAIYSAISTSHRALSYLTTAIQKFTGWISADSTSEMPWSWWLITSSLYRCSNWRLIKSFTGLLTATS